MITVTSSILLLLFSVGFVAGFVDSIAGGGGLIALPTLLLVGLPPHLALGTNKGQSVFGTASALFKFYKSSSFIDSRRGLASFPAAFFGAVIGVFTIAFVPNKVLTPVIMALLFCVAFFMIFFRPPKKRLEAFVKPHYSLWLSVAIALALGFYDGFFGPGTGMFLITLFVLIWRDSLTAATANAKVVNFASNLGSLFIFCTKGWVVWKCALPMAGGQMLGGFLGAKLTITIGPQLVRVLVTLVAFCLLIRLAFSLF